MTRAPGSHLENELGLEQRVFGADHPSTAGTLGEIGLVALAQGRSPRVGMTGVR